MSHLSHLRTFLEAYRSGSFSKAAELLGITQPAASQHIQSLETLVGKRLFIRCHERCNSDPHPTPEIRSRG
ncbi:helix-turn-helix domain-containing protein [Escherichia coli]